ncbi:MAG: RluA family pseudouridine synthase [Bacteroidales bacterium]|nr:RluA family pseudouridine synthase [Bacteroidales bacterium]
MDINIINPEERLYEHFRFEIDKGQGLIRIDKYLSGRLDNATRSKLQSAARAGNILVNGIPVKPSYKVKPGDIISIVLASPPRDHEILPEDIKIDVLYEDEDLVVINKQAGMVVHPAYGNYKGTLLNALLYHFQTSGHPGHSEPVRPKLVHRIDKYTSGVMVIAKHDLAQARLSRQFYKHSINRKYFALVWGDFEQDTGTISGNIGRNPMNRKSMKVFPEGNHGKDAITHYRVIERFGYVTLIECELETGRTHQIRVHMSYAGHPLFNDETYGGNMILKGTTFSKYRQFVENCFQYLPRQALHARLLGFKHPVTGNEMTFETDLPSDMRFVVEKWRKYAVSKQLTEEE